MDEAERLEDGGVEELDLPTRQTTAEERTWGMVLHLTTFSGTVLQIPFAGVIVPLIIWQMKKGESRFLDHQGREVLNFQITVLLGVLISIPLMLVIVGILTAVAILVVSIVYTIIAAIKANEGVWYTYPWSIKFIKPAPLPEN